MASLLENQRKFSVFFAVFLGTLFLLAIDRISGEVYQEIVIYTLGLYMAGNAAEHFSKRDKS